MAGLGLGRFFKSADKSGLLPRVRVLLPYKDKYLLEELQNSKYPESFGKMRAPGGGIEGDETPIRAAIREMHEEFGLKSQEDQYEYLGERDHHLYGNPEHYVICHRHGLMPGTYQSSLADEGQIQLTGGLPTGDRYFGTNIDSLLGEYKSAGVLGGLLKAAELSPELTLQPHQLRVQQKVRKQLANDGQVRLALIHGLGSGKCVRGWVPVFTENGPKAISSLFSDDLPLDVTEEWIAPAIPLKVLSYDRHRTVWRNVRKLYRQRIADTEPTYKITTQRGRVIEGTGAHKLLVYTPQGIVWKRLDEIGKFDCLPTPESLSGLNHKTTPSVPAELVSLLCWQIAEGHEVAECNGRKQYTTSITQQDISVLERLRDLFKACIPSSSSGYIRTGGANHLPKLEITSKEYVELLQSLGHVWGNRSATKRLPDVFCSLPDELLQLIVSAFIASEGSVSKGLVEIASASRELLEQLRYILLRFGMSSGLHSKRGRATNGKNIWRTYYRLNVSGYSVKTLARMRVEHDEKQRLIEKLAEKKTNPNFGVYVADLFAELKRLNLNGFLRPVVTVLPGKRGVSPEVALRMASHLETPPDTSDRLQRMGGMAGKWARRTEAAVAANRQAMVALARTLRDRVDGNYSYDPVVKAERVGWGGLVYDLEIEADDYDSHNYLAGYGALVSHNTISSVGALDEIGGPATAVVPAALRENYRKDIAKAAPTNTDIEVISQDALGSGAMVQPNVVVDEAQRLRNPNSARGRALLDVAPDLRSLILLSGTPVVNSPSDLAPIMSALTGKEITPEKFNERYVRQTDERPSLLGRLFGARTKPMGIKHESELADLLRGKVDYHAAAHAPARVDNEDIRVTMSPDQDKLYRGMYEKLPFFVRRRLESDYPLSPDELKKYTAFLTGPRQVGLSTYTLMKGQSDPMKAFKRSPKLQQAFANLKATLNKNPNARALVFSNFIDAGLTPYAAALNKAGIPASVFSGALSDEERKKLVSDVNQGNTRAVLIGPAGTEGLSFKGTRLIQLLDPHWNDARRRQSIGRGLRWDSHAHLPEAERQVKVERYFSSPRPVGFFNRYLLGKKARPGADDILTGASERKETLNEIFNQFIRRVGSDEA